MVVFVSNLRRIFYYISPIRFPDSKFFLQSLGRCQLKDVVAGKPEKLDASGISLSPSLSQYNFPNNDLNCLLILLLNQTVS